LSFIHQEGKQREADIKPPRADEGTGAHWDGRLVQTCLKGRQRMGMTIAEKILACHGGVEKVRPGDIITVKVDYAIQPDLAFTEKLGELQRVWDPDRILLVFDHVVPAANVALAEAHQYARNFAKRLGITHVYDVGRQGVAHEVAAEKGFLRPGGLIACPDSHTATSGAFNCAGRGLGLPEMLYAMAKGETWFPVCETLRFRIVGKMPDGVMSKDVILHIAATYGTEAAVNKNVEFMGPTVSEWSLSSRITVANMAAEIGAEFALFEADQKVIDYVGSRTDKPFEPVRPDPDAEYSETYEIDVSNLEPQVALPHSPGNARPVSESEGTPIDQVFVGSCCNGRLEDLECVARILHGRTVHPSVRMIITPTTRETYLQALEKGLIKLFVDAGACVTNPTCGACYGGHMGVLAPGERCISTANRNFQGRMGSKDAFIYLASPATAAASAVTGKITDPRRWRG
jgi:3-isopropylmalate/(R)-2-methylmalate dehydratase large subunit